MKKRICTVALCLLVAVVGSSCSSGHKMPKHRKNRRCNCPTFSENQIKADFYVVSRTDNQL